MYKKNRIQATSLKVNTSYIAESLEHKIKRILNNEEPIKDGAPIIYTERKDGVMPAYNIRTDRWEVAIDAMEGISKAHIARREERGKVIEMKKDSKTETTEGTGETQ